MFSTYWDNLLNYFLLPLRYLIRFIRESHRTSWWRFWGRNELLCLFPKLTLLHFENSAKHVTTTLLWVFSQNSLFFLLQSFHKRKNRIQGFSGTHRDTVLLSQTSSSRGRIYALSSPGICLPYTLCFTHFCGLCFWIETEARIHWYNGACSYNKI